MQQTMSLIAAMAEVYGEPITAARLRLYAGALEDYSPQEIETAIKRALKSMKWFPKPAELIEIMAAYRRDARMRQLEVDEMTDDEREASAQVLDMIRRSMGWS